MSDIVSGNGETVVALIFDGLINLNLSGEPIDPSAVELDSFGVVRLSSESVGAKNAVAPRHREAPSNASFWSSLSEGASAMGPLPIIFSNASCCLPNAISFVAPSSAVSIRERVCGKSGPFRLRDFADQIDFSRVCEISQQSEGSYIILSGQHAFGLSVAFAPMYCTIPGAATCEVFSLPYSTLVAKLCCGWFKLEEDYYLVRISDMPPGLPESAFDAVGSIVDDAISVMKNKTRKEEIQWEAPTSRITLVPRCQSGGSLESPRKRITLVPRLESKGDIYKDKDGWSLPEVASSESIATFLGSLKSETEAYLGALVSRSKENTCALCPIRAFSKKRESS